MTESSPDERAGVTKLQVVVVLAALLMLSGLFLAALGNVRDAASRSNCNNNNKQIALAIHNYHSTYQHYPAATMPNAALEPERRLSWMMAIQPYIESNALYSRTDKNAAWDAEHNRPQTMIRWGIYLCPMAPDPNPITTNYVGLAGVGADAALLPGNDLRVGVFGYDRMVREADCADGLSNTVLIAESFTGGPWAQGGASTARSLDPAARPYAGPGCVLGSRHLSERRVFNRNLTGSYVSMIDASVRFVTETISPELWEALATIHGKETLTLD